MSQETEYKEARSGMAKTIRWQEQPSGEKQEQNSIYIGNVIEGEYVDKKEGLGDNKSTMYFIKMKDGTEVALWGNAIIDDRFKKGDNGKEIGLWSRVRITCLGFKQSKKSSSRTYRDFKVEFAPPIMKEAAIPNANQPQY